MTVDAVTYFEEHAEEYDRSRTVRFPKYVEALDVMAQILPFDPSAAITVLDLGCGTGELARRIGARFPKAHFLCLDAAPTMVRIAVEKLQAHRLQATALQRNFTEPDWHRGLPACDAAVASYALNHVPVAKQRQVLGDCLRLLRPGGIFLSFDGFAPRDPLITEVYQRLRSNEKDSGERAGGKPGNEVQIEHYFVTVEDRLAMMTEAGYSPVDCVWKYFKLAVLVGHRQDNR